MSRWNGPCVRSCRCHEGERAYVLSPEAEGRKEGMLGVYLARGREMSHAAYRADAFGDGDGTRRQSRARHSTARHRTESRHGKG